MINSIKILSAAKYTKGTRLLIKIEKEAYLGTVTTTRNGEVHIIFDDGDKGKVKEKSKFILGEGIKRKVKKPIQLNNIESYLTDKGNSRKITKTKTKTDTIKVVEPKQEAPRKLTLDEIIEKARTSKPLDPQIDELEKALLKKFKKVLNPITAEQERFRYHNSIGHSTKQGSTSETTLADLDKFFVSKNMKRKHGDNWVSGDGLLLVSVSLINYSGADGKNILPYYTISIRKLDTPYR